MGFDPMIELLDELDSEERDVRADDREQEEPGSTDWYPEWDGDCLRPADEDRAGGRNTMTRFAPADRCTP